MDKHEHWPLLMNNRLLLSALLFLVCLLFSTASYAQPANGQTGIGGQIGEPSGVTLKLYNPNGLSYDFLAAFDLDNFFFLNVHGLYHRPIEDIEGEVNVFYGPGGFIGIHDRGDDEVALGISGTVGLNYLIEQFEIYAQITPRFEVIPRTDGEIGGGLGVRFYF